MLQKRWSENGYQSTPRCIKHNLKNDRPVLSESKLAVFGLVASILVIVGKLLFTYQDEIRNFFIERRLFTLEIIHEDGAVMYQHVWKSVIKFSNIWLPILCGIVTTYFTWIMVYLDSHVPGIQPPSPLSPTKYKTKSGHSFHLNYVFAVLVGILVTCYMYWKNVNIHY